MWPSRGSEKSARMHGHTCEDSITMLTPGGKAILGHMLRSGFLKSWIPQNFRAFRFGEYGMQRFNSWGLK